MYRRHLGMTAPGPDCIRASAPIRRGLRKRDFIDVRTSDVRPYPQKWCSLCLTPSGVTKSISATMATLAELEKQRSAPHGDRLPQPHERLALARCLLEQP